MQRAFTKLFGGPDVRILMVGLDNAGKTTILYKFRLDETVSTVPTIGFNVETVKYKNIAFTVWDIGGQVTLFFNSILIYTLCPCLSWILTIFPSVACRQAVGRQAFAL